MPMIAMKRPSACGAFPNSIALLTSECSGLHVAALPIVEYDGSRVGIDAHHAVDGPVLYDLDREEAIERMYISDLRPRDVLIQVCLGYGLC